MGMRDRIPSVLLSTVRQEARSTTTVFAVTARSGTNSWCCEPPDRVSLERRSSAGVEQHWALRRCADVAPIVGL
jgi:hypothetical protein